MELSEQNLKDRNLVFFLESSRILYVKFLPQPDTHGGGSDALVQQTQAVITILLGQKKKIPFLIDTTNIGSEISMEALQRWSRDDRLLQVRLGEAYLVKRYADLIFFRQHKRLNKPDYPSEIFNNLEEAVNWLSVL